MAVLSPSSSSSSMWAKCAGLELDDACGEGGEVGMTSPCGAKAVSLSSSSRINSVPISRMASSDELVSSLERVAGGPVILVGAEVIGRGRM